MSCAIIASFTVHIQTHTQVELFMGCFYVYFCFGKKKNLVLSHPTANIMFHNGESNHVFIAFNLSIES